MRDEEFMIKGFWSSTANTSQKLFVVSRPARFCRGFPYPNVVAVLWQMEENLEHSRPQIGVTPRVSGLRRDA